MMQSVTVTSPRGGGGCYAAAQAVAAGPAGPGLAADGQVVVDRAVADRAPSLAMPGDGAAPRRWPPFS